MILGVACLVTLELTNQAKSQHIKVANSIQDLVTDKLIFMTQSIVIQNTLVIHNYGVVQATALDQVVLTEVFKILHQAKCSGPADFFNKGGG